jgi:hypothetical protein
MSSTIHDDPLEEEGFQFPARIADIPEMFIAIF